MTNNPGQNNYKGINAQAWAAMSLFLQYLRDPNFSYIQLEAPGFQDFNLVFKNDRKIICESKARSKAINYSDVKKILSTILLKKTIKEDDEILIICTDLDKKLADDVKNIKYWSTLIAPQFKKKGFTDAEIVILEKVRFWVISESKNHLVVYSLFGELLGFWLPEDELEAKADSILIKKIYEGSSKGEKFSREDIVKEINNIGEKAKKYSGYFDDARVKTEVQFKNILDALNNSKSPVWASSQLAAISAKPSLAYFLLDRLSQKKIKKLADWRELWELYKIYRFSFALSRIFEENLNSPENKKFILGFFNDRVKTLQRFYQSDYFDINVVKIVTKIITGTDGENYLNDSFDIIKKLITFNQKDFFYLKDGGDGRNQWEREELCKLLHAIFKHKGASVQLKDKIFDLLVLAFNITEDDGQFSHYAPREVYQMVYEWLDENFQIRLPILVNIIVGQYELYYKKFGSKAKFNGWEGSGGGISYSGNYMGSSYNISERHFVMYILTPAIKKFYDANNNSGWQFVKDKCISSEKMVKKSRPDFLNRSVYEIVIDRYSNKDNNISQEAFDILKEFVLSRRGVPHKTDLVYKSILDSNISDDKKWKLAEITIEKHGVPVNPFIESIVVNLAKNGHKQAKETLKKWFTDKKYYQHFRFDRDSVSTIRKLLDSNLNLAIELFKNFITSDYIKNGTGDRFSAYSVAALLYEIIKRDYGSGLDIIRILEKEEKLNEDQQIIYSFGLINHYGNDESDNQELLLKVYTEVVNPFLKKYDSIDKIFQRLTMDSCREAFVQFAVRLSAHRNIAEALRIVHVFINDPDPYLPGQNPSDPENKYSEHQKIIKGEEPVVLASVRGWCGWVLMKCSVLDGRVYIPEIIDLTKKLIEDKNYYVVHMTCSALHQIETNRLTVLPTNRDILFFNNDKTKALKLSKEVESIAFSLLDRFLGWPELVQKAMAKSILHVFDPIRSLNEKDSLKLVNSLAELPIEVIGEAAPLFLYFAEFRKESYGNWRFSVPGLYDDLGPEKYDDSKFKKVLADVIKKIQVENPDNCFRFVSSLEHIMRDSEPNEKEKYSNLFLEYCEKYFSRAYSHTVFLLIYQVIKDKLSKKETDFDRWYNLYVHCLDVENKFYKKVLSDPKNQGNNTYQGMYWWPSLYNAETLESIYAIVGPEKFLNAAKYVFSFPKGFELHESDILISVIKKLPKNNKEVKTIKKYLREKNPSKYWDLK